MIAGARRRRAARGARVDLVLEGSRLARSMWDAADVGDLALAEARYVALVRVTRRLEALGGGAYGPLHAEATSFERTSSGHRDAPGLPALTGCPS